MKNTFLILTFLLFSITLFAQCPWNRVNCSHGCGRHFDENGDGYCDYSIIEKPKLVIEDTIKKTDFATDKSVVKKDSTIKKKSKIENISNKDNTVSANIIATDTISKKDTSTIQPLENFQTDKPSKSESKPYDLILISTITLLLYSLSFLLEKFKKISIKLHRRIWNSILLVTFLISCLFGFFLVIQINYQFAIDWLRTLLYWHVQIGISMTLIAVFHIFWHLKYFKNIFTK